MTQPVILHCAELGRDISALCHAVPDAMVFDARLEPSGCLHAHQAAVAMADERGWDSVWVLEDDAVMTPAYSRARWEADVLWSRLHGYGVLVGACVTTSRPKPAGRGGLVAVETFHSAHCIVYHRSAYAIAAQMTRPLDVQLGERGANPVVAVPFVAHQAPGWSAHLKKDVDYTPMYDRHERFLLSVARRAA